MAKAPKKQKATAEEKQLQAQSIAQWNDYTSRFRPAEQALAKKAEFTAGEKASVKGQASADAAAAFKGLPRNTVASGEQAGADANSGKTKFNLAADADAAGTARGLSQGIAVTGGELDSESQKLGLAALGRNVAGNVTSDLSRGARRATSLALAASEARFQRNQANTNAAFSVAGAATRKFGPELLDKFKKPEKGVTLDKFDFGEQATINSAFPDNHNPFSDFGV